MTSLSKLIYAISLFGLTSCSNIDRNEIDAIIYGVYTGECYGHCATMYQLEKDRLLVDTTDSFFKSKSNAMIFNGYSLDSTQFQKAKEVINQLPDILLTSNSKSFGSPDAYDQGGIFIQIKSGAKTKSFYIDTELKLIPTELRNYAKLIMKVTGFKAL